MSGGLDLNKLKDGLIDAGKELIQKTIRDATDGIVSIESLANGRIQIDANKYVDNLMSLLNEKLDENHLDSLELPDFALEFSHNVACGIVMPGTVDVQDGTIGGLANFSRTDDSEIKIDAFGNPKISARARFGIRNTNVEYGAKVTVVCFGPQCKIVGTLDDVSLEIELYADIGASNFIVTVNKFEVSKDGDFNVEIQNLGNFDYLSEQILQDLKVNVGKTVREHLLKTVKERLESLISTLPLETYDKK